MINLAWHIFTSSLLGFAIIGSTLICNLGQTFGYMASYSIQYITADRDGQSLALKATRRHFILQSTAQHVRHQVCMHLDFAAWLAMHHSQYSWAFNGFHQVTYCSTQSMAHGAISSNWFERWTHIGSDAHIKYACTLTLLLGLQCTTVGTHEHLTAFIKWHTFQHSQWLMGPFQATGLSAEPT